MLGDETFDDVEFCRGYLVLIILDADSSSSSGASGAFGSGGGFWYPVGSLLWQHLSFRSAVIAPSCVNTMVSGSNS